MTEELRVGDFIKVLFDASIQPIYGKIGIIYKIAPYWNIVLEDNPQIVLSERTSLTKWDSVTNRTM